MNDVAAAALEVHDPSARARRRNRNWFYFGAALAMLALVLAGFSSSFYLRGIVVSRAPAPAPEAYLLVHGSVMTAWYLLFVVQTFLVATWRTAQHRRLGVLGVVLAVGVVLTGAYVSISFPAHLAELGLPPDQVMGIGLGTAIGNLSMLIWFSGFVAAAVLLRRRREWHRSLMFWSFFMTLPPAFGDGPNNGARLLGPILPGEIALPILTAIAWASLLVLDWRMRTRIHPATLVCPVLVLVSVVTNIAAGVTFSTPATLTLFLRMG